MRHNMDTIRWSTGRLECLGRNTAVRWSLRLARREAARTRLKRIKAGSRERLRGTRVFRLIARAVVWH